MSGLYKIHSRVLLVLLILSVFSLTSFSPALGQQKNEQKSGSKEEKSKQKDEDILQLRTELVLLDVTVVNENNQPVKDLKQELFQVYEDRILQKIEFFNREEVPVSIGLVIDTSGTMRSKLERVIKASINFVKQSRPKDELFLIDFKEEPTLVEDFTDDIGAIQDALNDLVASGGTALLDAIVVAAEHAHKNGKHRRKALVVVSDGLEEDSYYKKEQVIDKLREADVQVYLVGFTNDLDSSGALFRRSQKSRAEKLLKTIADDSGGRAFFPKDVSEINEIANQIAQDIRTQYVVGYYPSNTRKDGTYRRITVKVEDGNRKLVARTRAGYVAKGDQPGQPQPGSRPQDHK